MLIRPFEWQFDKPYQSLSLYTKTYEHSRHDLVRFEWGRMIWAYLLSLARTGKLWNRDSSPTGQFTDTHFEDSSPTELKTVHRQNWRQFINKFYIVFIRNVAIFNIYWYYNEQRPNIKLIKLPICYCNMILIDMHTTAYIAIITLSLRKYVLYH